MGNMGCYIFVTLGLMSRLMINMKCYTYVTLGFLGYCLLPSYVGNENDSVSISNSFYCDMIL